MAQAEVKGLFEYLKWGTPGPPTTSIGIWSGGSLTVDTDLRVREGAGGQESRRGGLLKLGGNADFYVTATNADLVGYAFRASYPRGALTALQFLGGTDLWGILYTNSYINSLKLTYGQGEGLRANVTWVSRWASVSTGAASYPVCETALDFEDYDCVITFEGLQYGVLSFEMTLENNVDTVSSGDTKAAGYERFPLSSLMGKEVVTCSIRTGRPLPIATLGILDYIQPLNLDIVLTGDNGTDTCSIALAGMTPQDTSLDQFDSNTQVEWPYSFRGDSCAGCATWTFTPG
jgi:hypothetical protein